MMTLLLHPSQWDFLVDANGNIAVAAEPYAIAQDVASACRLFLGEMYYDTSQGVPYFENVLGNSPKLALLQSYYQEAALTVPNVAKAKCNALWYNDRHVSGNIEIIDINGQANNVQFF
jgi:hypothetical protein